MGALLRKCVSFLRLPVREKFWFFWLFLLSGPIRAAILLLPFRWLAPRIGVHYENLQLATVVSEEQRMLAWHIGRMMELAAAYTPWESKCLVQAIATKVLLAHYRIPYVLYLGVTKGPDGSELKAHAWLSVGPWIITGRDGHRAFTIVSTFVSPLLLTVGVVDGTVNES